MARLDQKGRNRHTRHVRLDHSILVCLAFLALSGGAVKVLLHLATLDNGKNNGSLILSVRDAATATGLGKNVAQRALAQLTDAGFIVPTSVGYCAVKVGPQASTWRLTWLAWPGRSGPTNSFLASRPAEAPEPG